MNETLSILGGIVVALAASIGLGNLLLAIYQRWTGNKDKQMAIHETNREAELDHDGEFQDRLLARVAALETQIEAMREKQFAQAEVQGALKLENAHLKHDNDRQTEEIKALQEQDVARLERIAHLEQQVEMLTAEVETLKKMSALSSEDMKTLTDSAATIQDSIERLGFVPTGPLSENDIAAVQRLKEIREASENIAKVVGT